MISCSVDRLTLIVKSPHRYEDVVTLQPAIDSMNVGTFLIVGWS